MKDIDIDIIVFDGKTTTHGKILYVVRWFWLQFSVPISTFSFGVFDFLFLFNFQFLNSEPCSGRSIIVVAIIIIRGRLFIFFFLLHHHHLVVMGDRVPNSPYLLLN